MEHLITIEPRVKTDDPNIKEIDQILSQYRYDSLKSLASLFVKEVRNGFQIHLSDADISKLSNLENIKDVDGFLKLKELMARQGFLVVSDLEDFRRSEANKVISEEIHHKSLAELASGRK